MSETQPPEKPSEENNKSFRLGPYFTATARKAGHYYPIRASEDEKISLEKQLRTDPTTGLANALAINEGVQQWAERENGDPDEEMAVVVIDLDEFKKVNDTYGHKSGDEILRAFAVELCSLSANLQASLRGTDIVGRSHEKGDEFIIVLTFQQGEDYDMHRRKDQTIDVIKGIIREKMSEKIKASLIKRYGAEDKRSIEFSMGVSITTRKDVAEDGFDKYKHEADIAMFEEKRVRKQEVIDLIELNNYHI